MKNGDVPAIAGNIAVSFRPISSTLRAEAVEPHGF